MITFFAHYIYCANYVYSYLFVAWDAIEDNNAWQDVISNCYFLQHNRYNFIKYNATIGREQVLEKKEF